MKKFFLSLAIFVMALCANAQTNQYFWYQGNLMMGNPIAQIDSVTFGENEPTDTLHILLPRTIIKEVHDTVYITIHDTVCPNDIPEGALSGEFSVSATKKVRFSKGNLQYQASTDTWRFAENQWDFIGEDNSNISPTYDGWIDLFGWGTGNNPTNTSVNNSDYETFIDWSINIITNGDNQNNKWRTISKEEFVYLFYTRPKASILFGFGNINGVNGIIVLPDDWDTPTYVSFNPSTTMGLVDEGSYYSSGYESIFSHNTYSTEQWKILESKGAIFLPAAGYRFGTGVGDVNYAGSYHSSTPNDEGQKYYLCFHPYDILLQASWNRTDAHSVRLVQDVE